MRSKRGYGADIQGSMERYREIFAQVENHTKGLLQQIGQNMEVYSSTTKKHFDDLGEIANEHIGNAVERIGGAIDDLNEQLNELNDTVGNIIRSLQRLR